MSVIENSEIEEEILWIKLISRNSAFDFLSEPEEDVYLNNDGKPLDD